MNTLARLLATPAVLISASAAVAQAQDYNAPVYDNRSYQEAAYRPGGQAVAQQELDRILAPVALYPDSLLSQLLMAATYPQDVAQAALWSRANPQLQGDAAVRAIENEPWHPSVKSLVAFPDVLKAMGEQPDWVRRLGDAFLAGEGAVMQTVQQLRRRADEQGNLRSTEQITVERSGNDYILEPPTPEAVYVPYYDPRTVYGSWWWPGYSPVFWNPWPGYAYYRGGWGWGRPIALRPGFWYSGFNWRGHHVRYNNHRPYYVGNGHYSRDWRGGRGDAGNRGGSWNNGGGDGRYNGRPGPDRPQYRDGGPQYREGNRSPRVDQAQGNTQPRYNGAQTRTAAPRYGLEGGTGGTRYRGDRQYTGAQQQRAPAELRAPAAPNVQRAPSVQRVGPSQAVPQPQRLVPSTQAFVPQQQQAAPAAPRHVAPQQVRSAAQQKPMVSEGARGDGNRGGGDRGGGRGRER